MSRASRRANRESAIRAHNAKSKTDCSNSKSSYFSNSKNNVEAIRNKMRSNISNG